MTTETHPQARIDQLEGQIVDPQIAVCGIAHRVGGDASRFVRGASTPRTTTDAGPPRRSRSRARSHDGRQRRRGTPSADHPVATVEGWGAGPCVELELAVTVDGRLGCVHLDVLRDPLTG